MLSQHSFENSSTNENNISQGHPLTTKMDILPIFSQGKLRLIE